MFIYHSLGAVARGRQGRARRPHSGSPPLPRRPPSPPPVPSGPRLQVEGYLHALFGTRLVCLKELTLCALRRILR